MNNTRKLPQKSRVFPENPYSATGLTDRTPTNQNKALLSRIKANFGKISQNSLNFAAHISEYCQNRGEKREAYRIASKIIGCDRKQIKAICQKLDQLQSRLNLNFDGGCGND